jgi:rare lipoprotein A (peptidoglycan hydrolase)
MVTLRAVQLRGPAVHEETEMRLAQILSLSIACLGSTLFLAVVSTPADAGGWATIHRYARRTEKCGGSREVLASYYGTGRRTANGELFNPHGLTAASYDYALGGVISVKNPLTGRICAIRINDRGPHGIARRMGARIDFTLGAARCLGMRASQYVCAP